MRKFALVTALAGLLLAALPGQPAAAASAFTAPCPVYGDLHICTAQVPSFDGTRLDVDLTLPMEGSGDRHPLIVMPHGFGNNKREWESLTDQADGGDKWHWNSHWFAEHGFFVLTYTARGFNTGRPTGSQPPTPSSTSASPTDLYATIHLKSTEFEIHDTQWLAALAALAFPDLARDQVAISGGSYGGGESWTQAAEPIWSFPHGLNPALPVLRLQVAVPKYPWTDLAYSLAPNGHGGGPQATDIYQASQGRPDNPEASDNPLGVPKLSYTGYFYADGSASGRFTHAEVAPYSHEEAQDGPVSTDAWFVRVGADPYPMDDPLVRQVRRGLTVFRSSYYQVAGWEAQRAAGEETAIFSISGWTDELFPPVESFRQFDYLKALDPLWPVEVATADIGHPRAQNKPDTWQRLNARAFQFLESNIHGSHRHQTTVTSEVTTCAGFSSSEAGAQEVTARTPEDLGKGELRVTFPGAADTFTVVSGASDPDSLNTDAIVDTASGTGMCRYSRASAFPGRWSGRSSGLAADVLYVGLGSVEVPYQLAGVTATLDARLWDVAPDGRQVLVDRGTYRLDLSPLDSLRPDRPTGTLRLPFYGNEWALAAGHSLRVDLAEVDTPTYLGDKTPNVLTIGAPTLRLPLHQARDITLTGTQTSA